MQHDAAHALPPDGHDGYNVIAFLLHGKASLCRLVSLVLVSSTGTYCSGDATA